MIHLENVVGRGLECRWTNLAALKVIPCCFQKNTFGSISRQ